MNNRRNVREVYNQIISTEKEDDDIIECIIAARDPESVAEAITHEGLLAYYVCNYQKIDDKICDTLMSFSSYDTEMSIIHSNYDGSMHNHWDFELGVERLEKYNTN